jgi:Flp pilus assembly protein TadG
MAKALSRSSSGNRRGASLVLAAVSLTALIGVGAVAVDLGMLLRARADAQRAAEAGALAGASAFLDFNPNSSAVITEARQRAEQFAEANAVLMSTVQPSEDSIVVIPAEQKVRVFVRRAAVGTWFAKIFGESAVGVGAKAAAAVQQVGGTNCVAPFMLPDIWNETSNQDRNPKNRWEDDNETWNFDPGQGDTYAPFNPQSPSSNQTGFGSNWRDGFRDGLNNQYTGDLGRLMTISRNRNGRDLNTYHLWTFPDANNGNKELEDRMDSACASEQSKRTVAVGDEYEYIPGDRNGLKIPQVMNGRINGDRNARWDSQRNEVVNSNSPDWRNSSRVMKVALFSPDQLVNLTPQGSAAVNFNNVALFFIESVDNNDDITGRFLYYVSGESTGGGPTASLIRRVRLVE